MQTYTHMPEHLKPEKIERVKTFWNQALSICDIDVKQKISSIYETIQDKIL